LTGLNVGLVLGLNIGLVLILDWS